MIITMILDNKEMEQLALTYAKAFRAQNDIKGGNKLSATEITQLVEDFFNSNDDSGHIRHLQQVDGYWEFTQIIDNIPMEYITAGILEDIRKCNNFSTEGEADD